MESVHKGSRFASSLIPNWVTASSKSPHSKVCIASHQAPPPSSSPGRKLKQPNPTSTAMMFEPELGPHDTPHLVHAFFFDST
ncbi:hypothetical protein KP509_31G035800 [Ceratopteris richardii]|nr:hypothetical protein KP509_31G035800 [Ceratopteris richardii]